MDSDSLFEIKVNAPLTIHGSGIVRFAVETWVHSLK